jgi:hypothetical protein
LELGASRLLGRLYWLSYICSPVSAFSILESLLGVKQHFWIPRDIHHVFVLIGFSCIFFCKVFKYFSPFKIKLFASFFLCVFLVVLGFDLRALHLLDKHPTTLLMPCFCGYVLDSVTLFAQAGLDYNRPTVGFQLFSIEMGSCKLFCLGWS